MRATMGLLALLTACGGGALKEAAVPADLVVVAKKVVSLEPGVTGEAVAVRDGRISWVGSAADAQARIGPETRVLRRMDAVVVPGLVDTHAHLWGLGKAVSQLDLNDTASAAEVASRVRGASPADGWIVGRGWDQNDWPDKTFPDHKPLTEASPSVPVSLRRVDGHAVWVNAAALKLAGVTRETPDPEGGRILRTTEGEPTGVLLDVAMALVEDRIPPPGDDTRRRWLQAAVAYCHEVGLTGVHDAGVSAEWLALYRAVDAAGELNLRVHVMLEGDDPTVAPLVEAGPVAGERVSVRGVKLYADGALGSRGAWLKAPYADAPDATGIPIVHGEALRARVQRYAEAGFQVGVHAIGDAAAADVLAAYEAAGVTPERRFRIEHAQIVDPGDQRRMAALGVLGMVQPTHATSDMPWAEERLGPERIRHAYAWRSMKRAGVRLALGSDFPVERPHPVEGLYAAVTRRDRAGQPAGGWYPEEALDPEEALRGFTTDAAWAGFVEDRRGRVAPGLDADLTLLDDDPTRVDPAKLATLTVVATVVAGEVVYEVP